MPAISDTSGRIVAMGYTHTVSLFIHNSWKQSLNFIWAFWVIFFFLSVSEISSLFTATRDNSDILGLPELFSPVASRSQ